MLQGAHLTRTRTLILALAAGLVAAFAFGAITTQSASAQGPGSEFCEEYPTFPGCEETGPTGGPGPTPEPGPIGGTTGVEGPSASIGGGGGGGGGDLPFTGYPLTALILLLIILLLVGLTIRAYLAARDRFGGSELP